MLSIVTLLMFHHLFFFFFFASTLLEETCSMYRGGGILTDQFIVYFALKLCLINCEYKSKIEGNHKSIELTFKKLIKLSTSKIIYKDLYSFC